MKGFYTSRRLLLALAAIALIAAPLTIPATAQQQDDSESSSNQLQIDPSIQGVWDKTDGPIARGEVSGAWIWGPEPLAASIEYYPESPTDYREMVYYDKGRLDLLNPELPPGSTWLVSGALLISEMLSGRVQLAETKFVRRELPDDIQLVGDFKQDNPVTYATLAPLSSVWAPEGESDYEPPRFQNRTGETVTQMLTPDGEVIPNAVPESGVTVASYDETLAHNIAAPFAEWASEQTLPETYLLGLPITEPYWVEAPVAGEQTRVLIQAFERRFMTYTPENAEGWRTETGNVGLHYREWRELERPDDPALARLASQTPFGEELIAAAEAAGIDPLMFVSVAMAASGGDPFATHDNGGQGLLAVSPSAAPENVDLNDPQVNAELGATQFAKWMLQLWDWETILAHYYSGGEPDENGSGLDQWVDNVLTRYENLKQEHPSISTRSTPRRTAGDLVGAGRVAYYGQGYTVDWWEETMAKHAGWGNAIEDWKPDPNGYYCVHPDYLVGERLLVLGNDITISCTIGDRVAEPHQANWRSKWALEMNWPAFKALELDQNNHVEVYYLDPRSEPEETPTPTPEPTAEPSGTPSPTPVG